MEPGDDRHLPPLSDRSSASTQVALQVQLVAGTNAGQAGQDFLFGKAAATIAR